MLRGQSPCDQMTKAYGIHGLNPHCQLMGIIVHGSLCVRTSNNPYTSPELIAAKQHCPATNHNKHHTARVCSATGKNYRGDSCVENGYVRRAEHMLDIYVMGEA